MFLFLACLTSPAEYDALLAQAQDADGDGYAALEYGGEDCNDTDASVSPAAEDICDSQDNDCDGGVDEGITIPIWYPDQDGDTFGVSEEGIAACFRPEGTVPEPGDCDDQDTKINPSADEVCDDQDNDCDGLIDDADELAEVPGQTWYPDADGDGYALDDALAEGFCTAPAGYVETLGDCNDSDKSVNPGAVEVCQDGIDNDCSGGAPECGFEGAYTLNRADLVLSPGGADFGSSFALVEVGETQPWLFVGTSNKVFAFEPPYDGSEEIETWDLRLKNDGTGKQVVSLGDSNGDGVDEIVSSYSDTSTYDGTVALFVSASGSGWQEVGTFDRHAISGSQFGFGFELSRYGEHGLLVGDLGHVYLWDSLPTTTSPLPTPDGVVEGDESYFAGFLNTTLLADLNGDGVDELVLGGLYGRMDVFDGGVSGSVSYLDSDRWLVSEAGYESSAFGGSPRAVDMDGDGYSELAVTDFSYSLEYNFAGAAWIVEGQWSGQASTENALASVRGSEAEARLGRTVEFLDGNDDGFYEIVVSEAGTGNIYLFDSADGLSDWTTGDSQANFVGINNGSCSAEFLVMDANHDGFDDLMTGCPDSGNGSLHLLLAPGL